MLLHEESMEEPQQTLKLLVVSHGVDPIPIVRVVIIETLSSLLQRHLFSSHISEEEPKLPHYPLNILDEESADAIRQATR